MLLRDLQQQRNTLRLWHALASMAWVVFGVAVALGLGNCLALAVSVTPLGFALLFALGALPCLVVTCYVLIGINTHFINELVRLEQRIALHPATVVEQMRCEIDTTLTTYQQWLREGATQPFGGPTPAEIRQHIEYSVQQAFTRALE